MSLRPCQLVLSPAARSSRRDHRHRHDLVLTDLDDIGYTLKEESVGKANRRKGQRRAKSEREGSSMTAMLVRYKNLMDQYGWAIVGVLGNRKDPPFAYTVGLLKLGHPELIIYGLEATEGAGEILNTVGARVRDGERVLPGHVIDNALGNGYKLMPVQVPDSSDTLTVANSFFRGDGDPVPAIQLVWPDKLHRFPWDDGYSVPVELQPVFALPPQSDSSSP